MVSKNKIESIGFNNNILLFHLSGLQFGIVESLSKDKGRYIIK